MPHGCRRVMLCVTEEDLARERLGLLPKRVRHVVHRLPPVYTVRPQSNGIAIGTAVLRPRRTNQAAGSSERGNAKQALVCPCPLQPSMPNGIPASVRPAPLACGCRARRSARHGRLSFDQSVANNILRSHFVTLTGRGVRLRRRL